MEHTNRGYAFAFLNMVVSGFAVYVNSLGVHMFPNAVLYTSLKNGVVGVVLLVPLALSRKRRAEYRTLHTSQWSLLIVVSIIGGSLAYALFFIGLRSTTPVTAALLSHSQFLIVAVLALLFLKERFSASVWGALGVLLVGLTVGIEASAVRWDAGAPLVIAATFLFAADFVVMKHLLRSVSALTVMTFKMSLGAALLFLYTALTGHLAAVDHLSFVQCGLVLLTGLILLAFTATSVLGLQRASATAVTAIPAAAPIVTTLLVVISRHTTIPPVRWFGLGLVLLSLLVLLIVARRQEMRARADH